MADRIANPFWLRAEGAGVHWPTVLRRQLARAQGPGKIDERWLARVSEQAKRRGGEIHLRWAVDEALGVPLEPFTVWMRRPAEEPARVEAAVVPVDGGLRITWGFVAADIEVLCDVADPGRAVALFATYAGGTLRETVGAVAQHVPSGGRIGLRVRCSGATAALLVNAHSPDVRCRPLRDILDDDRWEQLESVGLPAKQGTEYRPDPQGFVAAPVGAVDAAIERVARGGPPVGWWPLTESGRTAPEWTAPDPPTLVEEARRDVVDQLGPLFSAGIPSTDQHLIRHAPPVASPTGSDGTTSSLTAAADMPLLAVLTLPAASDPHLALALGFGTAYGADHVRGHEEVDFLVTGQYEDTPGRTGPVTLCAYLPGPWWPHHSTAPPTGLTALRAGLVAPEAVDRPWRETVRVSWDRPVVGAALGRAVSASLLRFDPAGPPQAECLLERREARDFRPFVLVPEGPEDTPAHGRTGMTDGAAEIPLGSGGRAAGYPVAVQDLFGVWSPWEDALHSGIEPVPPTPRVIAVAMDARYAGSPSCPATVTLDFAVEWDVRTPTDVELSLAFFPMASPTSPPPAGLGPDPADPPPPGGFRTLHAFSYTLDEKLTGAFDVVHLDPAGEVVVGPPYATTQGAARRYRVALDVPTLDFAATPRWGVQVWARSRLAAFGGAPSGWAPVPAQPALGRAASPVPVAPLPPPPLPGVPLGSTPDAEGRSHARVAWSLPAGADARQCVVWEVAESALRQRAGLSQRAPEGTVPGARLVALRDAYAAMSPAERRSAFRRMQVLPGGAREVDVTLPPGSTDIHLFAVTTVTSTGVESPWPLTSPAHAHLQAFMAPRLRRPDAPQTRSRVQADGSTVLELAAASAVAVERFELFRTRSPVAARSAGTMGPAFASVPVTAPAGPPDPATGQRPYTATHTAALPASWDEWLVRAVAVPVETVPEQAVRGLPSPASDIVAVTALPAGAPDLAPLTSALWGAANDGVVVRTSTSVPARPVALGSHRASAAAGAAAVAPVALEAVAEDPATPPAGATAAPVLVRAPRAGGRTPLALWFTRADPSAPVDVVVRLADPLGRVREERINVPGFVPPAPEPEHELRIVDVFTLPGRGVAVRLATNAPFTGDPPYALDIAVRPRRRPFGPGGFPPLPPTLERPISATFLLHELPETAEPGAREPISAVRDRDEIGLLLRVAPPFAFTAALRGSRGVEAEVRTAVR